MTILSKHTKEKKSSAILNVLDSRLFTLVVCWKIANFITPIDPINTMIFDILSNVVFMFKK